MPGPRRSLLDRYGAGTGSAVVHGACIAGLIAVFDPTPKPLAATIALSLPMPAIEPVEDVQTEATEQVAASAPPPPEATPGTTQTEVKPDQVHAEPPRPDELPPPVTTTAVEAPASVPPPPDPVVAKDLPPAPPMVQRPRPAPPAPPRPNASPQSTEPAPPSPAPPAPTPQQTARRGGADTMSDFVSRVQARMQRNQTYPREAERRGERGVAYLRFTIDRGGHVLAWRIDRSSGHAALDQEAAATLRRSDPLPQIPEHVPGQQLELVVPVQFLPR
jgi:protein TonB